MLNLGQTNRQIIQNLSKISSSFSPMFNYYDYYVLLSDLRLASSCGHCWTMMVIGHQQQTAHRINYSNSTKIYIIHYSQRPNSQHALEFKCYKQSQNYLLYASPDSPLDHQDYRDDSEIFTYFYINFFWTNILHFTSSHPSTLTGLSFK